MRKHNGIEYLRLLACISIILCHIPSNYGKISSTFGVSLFLLISGFMTSKTFKFDKNYLLKKYIKLAPIYYFFTLAVFIASSIFPQLFNSTNPSVANLIMSLLFIPFVQNGEMGYVFAIYAIGWYMILQMWFYVTYFVMALLFKEKRDLCFILFSLAALILVKLSGINNAVAIIYPQYIIYLTIGVLLNLIFTKLKIKVKDEPIYIIQTILFILALFAANKTNYYVNVVLSTIIFSISYAFNSEKYKLNKLSDCTYEVFLTHYFIVMFFNRVLPKIITIDNNNLIVQIIIIFVSLFVGLIVSIPNRNITNKLKEYLIR